MEWLVIYRGETLETATMVAQHTDAALLAVVWAYLKIHTTVERARKCLACGTLFVLRHGKQRYCSRTCTNRVASRRWRSTADHRALDKQRARARYAARRKAPPPHEG